MGSMGGYSVMVEGRVVEDNYCKDYGSGNHDQNSPHGGRTDVYRWDLPKGKVVVCRIRATAGMTRQKAD